MSCKLDSPHPNPQMEQHKSCPLSGLPAWAGRGSRWWCQDAPGPVDSSLTFFPNPPKYDRISKRFYITTAIDHILCRTPRGSKMIYADQPFGS